MVYLCDNLDTINGFVTPLVAAASVLTSVIIALGYMLGEVLHNPKVSLWAKTEIVQLVVSAASAIIIFLGIGLFCTFNFGAVGALFGLPVDGKESLNMFDAADGYLRTGGFYIKDLISATRYHLGGYNILQLRSLWKCEQGGTALNAVFCLFGSPIPGGVGGVSAGTGVSPESGYGFASSALSFAFNSLLFSYLSLFNYMFILNYAFSGLVLFFLPLGIFFRSMPYLRGLGSLFMALTIAFVFVYPSILAIFYLDLIGHRVLNPEPSNTFKNYIDADNRLEDVSGDDIFDLTLYDDLFGDHGGTANKEILTLTGNAFLIGVFIPSLAMLATIGSLMYLNRFMGQEVDLSRVVQMI